METVLARSEVRMNRSEMDQLAEKFGGRFKLTVLIQKRLKELCKGSQKLVDLESRNLINIVLEEIRQGKIGIEGLMGPDDEKKGKREKEKAEEKAEEKKE